SSSRRATSSSSCARCAHSSIGRTRTRASSRSFARCTSRSCATSSARAALDYVRHRVLFPLMPFRRFFERGAKREAPPDDDSSVEQIEPDQYGEPEAEANLDESEYEGDDSAPEDAREI